MTRPKPSLLAFVWALAAAGVGTLLWCAWLILTAPLPNGAAVAAWTLWLLCVAALVTLVAYLREMARHPDVTRAASWRPLPGLLLLWVAGLTALLAFPFVLPERAAGPSEASSAPTEPAPSQDPTAGSSTTSARDLQTSVSRASRSATTTTTRTATARPQPATSSAAPLPVTVGTSAPASTTSRPAPRPTTTAPPSPTSTSTPLLGVTLPRGTGKPTTKPPHER